VTTLIFFVLIGAALLVLLVVVARRSGRAEGSAQTLVDAKQALRALQSDLLPPGLVERIFATQDFDFVTSSTPLQVQRLFMRERKKVAVCWAQQVHAGVLGLMNFHLGQARFYAQLSPATEMKLAVNFAALLFACRVMQLALYLGGPFAVPGLVGRTVNNAARLCEASEKSLAFLEPPRLGGVSNDSASHSAAS
jgi:hypothetical protein